MDADKMQADVDRLERDWHAQLSTLRAGQSRLALERMAGVEISTAHWPLLLVKFDGEQTMRDVDYFIGEMAAAQARKEPYASISLMRKYSSERSQVQKVAAVDEGDRRRDQAVVRRQRHRQ